MAARTVLKSERKVSFDTNERKNPTVSLMFRNGPFVGRLRRVDEDGAVERNETKNRWRGSRWRPGRKPADRVSAAGADASGGRFGTTKSDGTRPHEKKTKTKTTKQNAMKTKTTRKREGSRTVTCRVSFTRLSFYRQSPLPSFFFCNVVGLFVIGRCRTGLI